jgi:galactonate dehydratase
VPTYELLGGPTRDRVRVYGRASSPDDIRKRKSEGYTVIKTGLAHEHPANIVENPRFIKHAVDSFAALRDAAGPDMDIGIDFHGNISPQTAKVVIKELERYQPMFIEEPCQAQNADVMADIAHGTHLPIATGERIFTKWGFRELLEKKAASILQPDLCHAGGITKVVSSQAWQRLIIFLSPHTTQWVPFLLLRDYNWQQVFQISWYRSRCRWEKVI